MSNLSYAQSRRGVLVRDTTYVGERYVCGNTGGRGDLLPCVSYELHHCIASLHFFTVHKISIMSDDNNDDFLVRGSSKFDWERSQSFSSGSASPLTTRAQTQKQAASLHQCAKMMSTMANLIQEGNEYAHNVAKKSDDAVEELKNDISMLVETILRVEERLTALEESNRKDTADTTKDLSEEEEEVIKDALDDVDNHIVAKSASFMNLEARVVSIERRIRYIEQMLVNCYKRRKVQKATAGRSA